MEYENKFQYVIHLVEIVYSRSKYFEPRCEKTGLRGFRPGPTQTRLQIRIKVEEKLYYQYSENKGADQLRGYREADLRLCFRICKKPVFSRRGSFDISV